MPDFLIEQSYLDRGFDRIAGIDEAGRGSLFGPVVAAAVILPSSWMRGRSPEWLAGVDDSKRLSPRKREILARFIIREAQAVGVGLASNKEIDRLNIHKASLTAMKRAAAGLVPAADILLVDGFELKDVHYIQKRVKQGDQKSISIAAASIVAKVLRDRMMVSLDGLFLGLGLSRHKGYGTREHFQALAEWGPTPLHRQSFNLRLNKWKR
ncbi:MAG: ribonuclease HII [Candidatus Aminicenantales bacterium]